MKAVWPRQSFWSKTTSHAKRVPSLHSTVAARQDVRTYSKPAIAGVTEDEIRSARTYCSNLLRRFDAPSYTLRPFVPQRAQDAYLALRAFNIDVSRIADATSTPAVGAMRMQFWRDAVSSALAHKPPKEPVAVLLANASASLAEQTQGTARFSRVWLHRVIGAREAHLHNPPFPDITALETYAESTYSTLLYLTLSALPVASVTADHLASHIGKAQGIAAVLRGLPLIAFPPPPNKHANQAAFGGDQRQGAVLLPLDIMARCGVREDEVLRKGAEAKGLRDAVFDVATRANDHIITAREMMKNLQAGRDVGHEFEYGDERRDHVQSGVNGDGPVTVPDQASEAEAGFSAYMPAVPTQLWLDRLQKSDFDVFHPSLLRSDWKLPIKAYWAWKRRFF